MCVYWCVCVCVYWCVCVLVCVCIISWGWHHRGTIVPVGAAKMLFVGANATLSQPLFQVMRHPGEPLWIREKPQREEPNQRGQRSASHATWM